MSQVGLPNVPEVIPGQCSESLPQRDPLAGASRFHSFPCLKSGLEGSVNETSHSRRRRDLNSQLEAESEREEGTWKLLLNTMQRRTLPSNGEKRRA
ncbi:hypothetical protein chiPu_0012376 [Chiloscyllium punctatum]|uniref:Uncharacterized protein n=1 Tax=Chiloscyllium punctatum TaxID=137246 RepID=A0A401SU28_CHIPU|nr:hypothetical protein [Chiloscyllium punctatum]